MTRLFINARFRQRPVTGVERFAMEVSARLAKTGGFQVTDISPSRSVSGLKGHLWEQLALPQKIDRDSILFSPCNTGPLVAKRQLAVIHDAAVWDFPEGFSPAFRKLYQELLPRLAKRAVVATVSEFSRTQLAPRLGLPEEKILVLGNAVSSDFSPGENAESAPRPLSLLCVGSMDPRKNINRLVNAWLALKAGGRLPDGACLKLVGGTNPKNFAAFERVEDSSIEWLGRVNDGTLIRLYREAGAFIYPSYYEGFGLPPLEAMACGCPVLLSREASLPEVGGPAFEPCQPDTNGVVIYFDPFSETAIGEAILKFLGMDSAQKIRMRENARARSREFSWDAVALRVAGGLRNIA